MRHKVLRIKHKGYCLKGVVALLGLAATFLSSPVAATAPALKVTPLKYQEVVPSDRGKLGFVDVENPTDTSVRLAAEVQAFRQVNLAGDLEFYDDKRIQDAIKVGIADFELGPREAARISFTIDPSKLHKGGVYAAIFFRTVPPAEITSLSHMAASAKVGTLLILNIGGEVVAEGKITAVKMPLVNLGGGLAGSIDYANTASFREAIAYNPKLKLKVGPWGRVTMVEGPLVMPGNTRRFSFDKTGSYLGIVPLIFIDETTGQSSRRWILAVTGWWRLLLPLAVMMAVSVGFIWRRLNRSGQP